MKRGLLFLLSFLVLLSTLSFSVTSVNYPENYEHPVLGTKTQIEAVEWIAALENVYCDYDGVSGAQCVDLIKAYYDFLGKTVVKGNANHYIYDSYSGCKVPEGWVRIQYYPGFIAQAGDIALFDHGTYGHIGLIVGADDSSMTTIENNRNNSLGSDVALKGDRKYTDMSFWGVIRPSFHTYYRGVTYALGEDGEHYIVYDFDNSTDTIVMLSKCNGLPVTTIGFSALIASKSVTNITIPNTIKYLKWGSIAHCHALKTLTIPSSVETIGGFAFFQNKSLKSITIPASVIAMGPGVFGECESLKTIYCEAESKPPEWDDSWSGTAEKIYWGYNKDSASNRYSILTSQIFGLQSSNYDTDQWADIQIVQSFADDYDFENSSLNDLYSVNNALEEILNGKALIKGDVDRNEIIDSLDYLLLKRAYFNTYELLDGDLLRSDIDNNKIIDEYDYLLLKRHHFNTYTIE